MTTEAPWADRIPVIVLTGFLGAGKTTLLNRVLAASPDTSTLVLINEYGEEGIDHHLVAALPGEHVLLPAGCVCCTIRSDLLEALDEAFARRRRGELPRFERVILETTGVADTTAIVATLSPASPLAPWFRLARVITCVDVGLVRGQIREFDEAGLQIAAADAVVLTKLDTTNESDVDGVLNELASLNPLALTLGADADDPLLASLFRGDGDVETSSELLETRLGLAGLSSSRPTTERRGHGYRSHTFRLDRRVRWNVFSAWLSVFTQLASERILRVKAIIHPDDGDHALIVHAVKHVVYPPEELPSYRDPRRRSMVVVIGRDLDDAYLRSIGDALATAQIDGAGGKQTKSA